MSTFARKTRCPGCGHKHSHTSNLTGTAGPRDGDVTVCVRCAGVWLFDSTASGGLVAPPPNQLLELAAEPRIAKVREAIRQRWS